LPPSGPSTSCSGQATEKRICRQLRRLSDLICFEQLASRRTMKNFSTSIDYVFGPALPIATVSNEVKVNNSAISIMNFIESIN
jgi:hypothetical protein